MFRHKFLRIERLNISYCKNPYQVPHDTLFVTHLEETPHTLD